MRFGAMDLMDLPLILLTIYRVIIMMDILYYSPSFSFHFNGRSSNLRKMTVRNLNLRKNLKHCLDFILFIKFLGFILTVIEVLDHKLIA